DAPSVGLEGSGPGPDGGEDLLGHVLGESAVATEAMGEGDHPAGVAQIELAEGFQIAAGGGREELFVERVVGGRGVHATGRSARREDGLTQREGSQEKRPAPRQDDRPPGGVRSLPAAAGRSRVDSWCPPWTGP